MFYHEAQLKNCQSGEMILFSCVSVFRFAGKKVKLERERGKGKFVSLIL